MILILTGPVHSGKTSLLKRAAAALMERGILVHGFLSESVWDKNQTIGYDLYNLQNKKSLPFIRKKGEDEWENIGAYFFLPSGLEIGPLELLEKGLWPALKHSFAIPPQRIICVVRAQILDNFLAKIKNPDIHIFDVRMENVFSLILEKLTSIDK